MATVGQHCGADLPCGDATLGRSSASGHQQAGRAHTRLPAGGHAAPRNESRAMLPASADSLRACETCAKPPGGPAPSAPRVFTRLSSRASCAFDLWFVHCSSSGRTEAVGGVW
eukprot:4512711-Prymnesium_polylepis.1